MAVVIAALNEKIDTLEKQEKLTKALLAEVSREVLLYLIETGDVQPVNRVMGVLTPVNKKAAKLFFKAHVPYLHVTDEAGEFTHFGKKDAKRAPEMLADLADKLEDPHFTIWTWADRNIEMEVKPYDVNKVVKAIEQGIKKAGKKATMEAILKAGLTLDDFLELVKE